MGFFGMFYPAAIKEVNYRGYKKQRNVLQLVTVKRQNAKCFQLLYICKNDKATYKKAIDIWLTAKPRESFPNFQHYHHVISIKKKKKKQACWGQLLNVFKEVECPKSVLSIG